MDISESACIIVLSPIFTANFEPDGNILLAKNRTAICKHLSSREERYSERRLTFIFLLVVLRIFSHIFTKYTNWVELLAEGTETELSVIISSQILMVLDRY